MNRSRVIIGTLAALFLSGSFEAQTRKWYEPYRSGLAAFHAGRWQDAIADLTEAMSVAPRCEANKRIEGTFYDDYCPEIYLALAHAGAGQLDEAERVWEQSRTRIPRKFDSTLNAAREQISAGRRRVDYNRRRDDAIAQITRREYRNAISALGKLRDLYPAEFDGEQLQRRVSEAEVGLIQQLVADGRALLTQTHPREAEERFRAALEIQQADPAALAGLSEVQGLYRQYERLVDVAHTQLTAGAPQLAVESLRQARRIDPQRFAASGTTGQLEAAVRALYRGDSARDDAALLIVECDSDCSIRVDDDPVSVPLKRTERRPIAVGTGTRKVVGISADGSATWQGHVVVNRDAPSRLSVPISNEMKRAAELRQRRSEIRGRIDRVRTSNAALRLTREQVAADTNSIAQGHLRAQARLSEIVARIRVLEATTESELAQAERDEKDAQEAERLASNNSMGDNGFAKFAQGTGAVLAVAKKISADNHRRRAQNALVEIGSLTRELYTLTKE